MTQHGPVIRARCSDECLHYWPSVVRQAGSAWERKFAEEMQARASNRFWRPSAQQLEIMRRMVAQVLGEVTDDIQVIEGGRK